MAESVRKKAPPGLNSIQSSIPIFILLTSAAVWFANVNAIVPEPYLDEYFHVGQARLYLQQQWRVWDPKITTPPGLYLIGYMWSSVVPLGNDLQRLRSVNLIAVTALLPWKAYNIRRHVISQKPQSSTEDEVAESEAQSIWVAANVGLFPPLFFFSALFYTDLWSVFWVLQTIESSIALSDSGASLEWAAVVISGLVSLWFRQTNIFWVAIFAGGMSIVKTVKIPTVKAASSQLTNHDWLEVFTISWNERSVYDPLVEEADFQDYLKTGVSTVIATVGGIQQVSRSFIPYGILLSAFAGFVAWNGGVVLGDKSNHVATIHLTQMVYIWPYIFFFSIPLILIIIVSILPGSILPTSLSTNLVHRHIPAMSLFGFTILVLGIIHFNTIIHPFTLADNRHYVFYVFRWFILSKPWLRYVWAPGYVVCAWLVIQCLGRSETFFQRIGIATQQKRQNKVKPTIARSPGGNDERNRVSFVLVWLAASFLSLATAPLVEPRYFILPWLIWRLHVPSPRVMLSKSSSSDDTYALWSRYGLAAETLWFLAINAATGYLFLYKGFEWSQEPGVIQRFMW